MYHLKKVTVTAKNIQIFLKSRNYIFNDIKFQFSIHKMGKTLSITDYYFLWNALINCL